MEKIKSLKFKLSASLFLLLSLVIFSAFFSGCFSRFAQALSSNYNKALPASLTLNEWNNLDDDFVAKSGDTMTGILDMGGNRVTNLATPVANTDAANKNYVDTQISSIGGTGSRAIFTNWGRPDCPAGSTFLYGGVAFSANTTWSGGASNLVCMDKLGVLTNTYNTSAPTADDMYPAITGNSLSLPTGFSEQKIVQCAVCQQSGTCYETFGSSDCNTGLGFNVLYSGYVLGGKSAGGSNPTKRVCINSNFDNSVNATASNGAILYGARIINNLGLSVYAEDSFIECAICCN